MFTELFFHEYYMIEKYDERFSIVNTEIVNRSLCRNICDFVIPIVITMRTEFGNR